MAGELIDAIMWWTGAFFWCCGATVVGSFAVYFVYAALWDMAAQLKGITRAGKHRFHVTRAAWGVTTGKWRWAKDDDDD